MAYSYILPYTGMRIFRFKNFKMPFSVTSVLKIAVSMIFGFIYFKISESIRQIFKIRLKSSFFGNVHSKNGFSMIFGFIHFKIHFKNNDFYHHGRDSAIAEIAHP